MSCDTTTAFQVGDKPRIIGTFLNQAGNPVDPGAIFAKIKNPSGTITLYEYGPDPQLQRSSVGIYYVDVDVEEAGTWYYRFYSTGSGQAAGEESFEVETSQF